MGRYDGQGHITKMADMSIHGKKNRNLFPQDYRPAAIETWHGAPGTRGLQGH